MPMSNYYRNLQLAGLNNGYLALYTSNPNYDNSGTEVNKISYAREQISVVQNINGEYKNSGDILYTTATEDWGVITHLAVFDAITGGNMLWFGAVEISQEIRTNEAFRIADSFLIFRVI